MADSTLRLRSLTDDDFTAVDTLIQRAFLVDPPHGDRELVRALYEPERTHGVFDGDELAGTGAIMSKAITLPGVGQVPFAAVTSVAVSQSHRRRGILRMVMDAQLRELHERGGEPIAGLWASEAAIYGRFGYGLATYYADITIAARSEFRPGVDLGEDRVREQDREHALPFLRELYDKVAPTRVGYLSRDDAAWTYVLDDGEHRREGSSKYRFAVHPQGCAVYRVKGDWGDVGPKGSLTVQHFLATTPTAYAALWRFLLDHDLIGELTYAAGPDEPLVHMLSNPRTARRRHSDGLWIRVVDVDRALSARRYATPVDAVLEVSDAGCPWNAGRWRFTANGGENDGDVRVSRTEAAADLALDITDLGAIYLGGTRLTTLAAAGRIRELTPGALARVSTAFLTDETPNCPEIF
ncbi:putative acetyltransferase [Herbihabitans rhizosphaerae]|uniref:Putative acetyltransferase n=1 Tax=Herbihabitans rhizosphaerae TaxID=1872711 RepID=A0A4V2ERH6_9PSEU|nr:GNAT family N-acetyltransferase [Herbihabitans rhizosphaerae]RZS31343.1 putative acetyltransferase [Herbihabitans rhizosphaerae]